MEDIKARFGKLKLNDKLRFVITLTMLVVMVLTLVVYTVSTVRSSFRKAEQEASAQVDFMASSYTNWLTSVENIINTLTLESVTQEFCEDGSWENASALTEFLGSYKYVSDDVRFIAVIDEDGDEYAYSGKSRGNTSLYFDQNYEKCISQSVSAQDKGSMTVGGGTEYTNGKTFTLTFYSPIYSPDIVDKEVGMVCLNMNDSLVSGTARSGDIEFSLTDSGGVILSSTDSERTLGQESIAGLDGGEGSLTGGGTYYFYKEIPGWNFYVVSSMPLNEIYFSSLKAAVLTVIFTIAIMLLALALVRRILDRSYQPMERVLSAMDSVADNNLDLRIETGDMGEDFEKLGTGFNHMIDDIGTLMDRVVDEQRQADQIRINALQSQIQPHFLYNTLDTIHWQARMDGNDEMSELVMALAKYYRICLSKGKDIISLREELEHINCYLLIQNKRYGDIIEYETMVPDELMQVKIPKLTLQPLVENSIYHGIRVKEGFSGTVCVGAQKSEDNKIMVWVADSGKGMNAEQVDEMNASISDYSREFGYGVRNVNRRIELMFGEEYGLFYRINKVGGVTVEITLPEDYEAEEESIFGGGR